MKQIKNRANQELKTWIYDTKRAYNIFKKMPARNLYHLGMVSGLDMSHYKTKSLMAKGLMIKLGTILPVQFSSWK